MAFLLTIIILNISKIFLVFDFLDNYSINTGGIYVLVLPLALTMRFSLTKTIVLIVFS